MHYNRFFTDEEIYQIHAASLDILENTGILVQNEKARLFYKKMGCTVEDNGVVKIPAALVEEARQSFVPEYKFTAQDPAFDKVMPKDAPIIVTGSSAPNIIDFKTGVERRATSTDIANIAHLINELPGFDVFSISTLAEDAPAGQLSISRFYPALKNCKKPVRSNTPNMHELYQVLQMAEIIAGSKEAYRERPFINHHYCPVISPLTMDVESTEAVMYLVEEGLPVYGTIVPNAGLTSPMSMTGTVVLGNAEFLALSTLIQHIRPGAPQIYAVLATVADMRTGAYAPGAIETGMLQMGLTEMANFYNLPSGGYIGLTNSYLNDAQSGYETGMNTTGALLAGASLFNMGGLLGSLMAFDFGKAVTDNEIALNLKRMKRGLEFSKENMCVDLIKEIGTGGSYMEEMHTFENMRNIAVYPKVAIRENREQWLSEGSPDYQARAMKFAADILLKKNSVGFTDDLDQKIRKQFPGLVSGKTVFTELALTK